jgi:hypothetical protein
LQDEGALVVPPAFAARGGLKNALTGEPGSLTIESLQERLTNLVDGVDFIAYLLPLTNRQLSG